jgi:predicted membrane-bound spermidine synthase
MTTTSVSRLANATWLVAVIYLVAQWLIALRFGLFAAAAVVLSLAIAGCIAALFCLRQALKQSARAILVPAIAGMILNTAALVVVIPNLVKAGERRHAPTVHASATNTPIDHASA